MKWDWREEARCNTQSAALFDAPSGESNPRQRIERAFTICRSCPVQADCLEDAIIHSDSGVRGGELFSNGHPVPLPGHTRQPLGGPGFHQERMRRLEAIEQMYRAGVRPRDMANALGVSRQSIDNDIRRHINKKVA